MHVVQVSVFVDRLRRGPTELLEVWDGLTVPAQAAAGAGLRVSVVQAAHQDGQIDRHGAAFHFVAERTPSPLRRRLGHWAAPLTHRVFRRVAALAPDVVHLHGLSFPRHALRLVAATRAPVLAQDHADRPGPPWRARILRRGLARLSGVLFTAREQARDFRAAAALPPHVPVFEVLESTSRFGPGDAAEARRETGLHGDPCFLWVGRLEPDKDPLAVLEAFSRTVAELPGARLWMCYGGGALLGAVESRLRSDPRLEGRVALLGERPHAQVETLLRASDFLVLGSRREAAGYAVLEALSCGTVPLVTDIPAFRRITGAGTVGALSPPGDAAEMSRAMVGWAGRDRPALRQAALEHFQRHLSLAAVGRELRRAYEAVHAKAAGARS